MDQRSRRRVEREDRDKTDDRAVVAGDESERAQFPVDTIGPVWTKSNLTDQGGGVFAAKVPRPDKGWMVFMVELEYPGAGTLPLHFTTEVSVVPDTVPFRKPGGLGAIRIAGEGKDAITVVDLKGDRYQMGYWYGRLLAGQISRVWAMVAKMGITEDQFKTAVESMWNNDNFDTMMWNRVARRGRTAARMPATVKLRTGLCRSGHVRRLPRPAQRRTRQLQSWYAWIPHRRCERPKKIRMAVNTKNATAGLTLH